jgi:hypothetical protein
VHTLLWHAAAARDAAAGTAWDGRSDAAVYIDLVCDGASLATTLLHYLHVWWLAGLGFSVVDFALLMNVQSALTALRDRWRKWRTYRQLDAAIDTEFREATHAQLAAEPADAATMEAAGAAAVKDCPICFEPMTAGKVLPVCGHIFHRACLKRWLLNSQSTCPMCRRGLTARLAEQQTQHAAVETARRRAAAAAAAPAAAAATAAGAGVTGPHAVIPPATVYAAGGAAPGNGWGGVGHAAGAAADMFAPWFAAAMGGGAGAALPPALSAAQAAATEAAVRNLAEMFPHLSVPGLRAHLLGPARGDFNATLEAALAGDLPLAAEDAPPPAPAPASAAPVAGAAGHTRSAPAGAAAAHAVPAAMPVTHAASTDAPYARAAAAPARAAAPSAGAWESDPESEEIDAEVTALASKPLAQQDRFALLQARQRAMVRRARRDYLRAWRVKAAGSGTKIVAVPAPAAAAHAADAPFRLSAASGVLPSTAGLALALDPARVPRTRVAAASAAGPADSTDGDHISQPQPQHEHVPAAGAGAVAAAAETPDQARQRRLAAIERRLRSGGGGTEQ